MKTISILLAVVMLSVGCSSQQLIVDPKTIKSQEVYEKDKEECKAVSESYDKTDAVIGNTALAATAGGVGVAGIAAAVAGAVFLPAVPFIIAGTVIAGAASGGSTKADEVAVREKIWVDCLNDRGYRAYKTN